MSNGYYVSWPLWDAEHRALTARVDAIEEAARGRRNRAWLIILGLMTGIVCPVTVTMIIAWLHLRGT